MIATGNPGKITEYADLIGDSGLELVAHDTRVKEVGADYLSNALLKARAATAATGQPSLGDDSGLELYALGGYPGLRSARIAASQPERTELLLRRLADHPRPWRARFVCALALAWPDGLEKTFVGLAEGEVIPARGGGGFGYDPVFLVPELGQTFAEMGRAEKHRHSHRGAAVRALVESGALHRLQPAS